MNSSRPTLREVTAVPLATVAQSLSRVHMRAPGTCGELVQGALDDQDFLVNCPIDLFARATAAPSSSKGLRVADAAQHDKVRRLADLLIERHGLPLAHEIRIDSTIPRGKGMASSTADLTAALSALCWSCGTRMTPEETGSLLAAVEPSDCVHYAGITCVNHLSGTRLSGWTAPAQLRVIVVDGGGEIDTVAFDRERARATYRQHEPTVRSYLELLGRSLARGDLAGIGEAAWRSATLSQDILPKPHFEGLSRIAAETGALGVNCAHSGTVLGLLYTETGEAGIAERLCSEIDREFGAAITVVGDYAVVGGGCWSGR